ncbi:MAG: hypothetical protein GWO07_11285, partial [Candidatus Dadabacteria bacterium]|nr:hypothetical protein [Candidatus Dadabacteria bacterium]NIV42130.1 hypothetical protein [Candidatus Dadabacteria bacterium]NIX15863.1 hypothetical protein [Candidatus Dadabacteria bacterium]
LVFSKRAVDHAKVSLKSKTIKSFKADLNLYKYQTSKEQQTVYMGAKNKISQIMNDYVGIIRKEEELHDALKEIGNLEQITDKLGSFYSIQLKNIITVCTLITKSALLRQESRGAHIREKFPNESKAWQAHIV